MAGGRKRTGVALVACGVALVAVGVIGLVGGIGESSSRAHARRGESGTPRATSTTAAAETPEAFLAALVAARRTGDATFLFDRLHPEVTARYGDAACRAAVGRLVDPTIQLTADGTAAPAPWDYTSDGKTTTVPEAVTVHVAGTLAGAPAQLDLHFAEVDGHFRYFIACGSSGA